MGASFRFPLLLLGLWLAQNAPAQSVLVQPYVQPGDRSTLGGTDAMAVLWVTDQVPGDFTVEFGPTNGPLRSAKASRVQFDFAPPKPKAEPPPPTPPREATKGPAANGGQHFFRYTAPLNDLPFDSQVLYRVKLGARVVREASFATRASTGKTIRFVTVGDLASGQAAQNAVAYQISRVQPQFVVLLGDIVYPSGRVSQYMDHFWTTYNQPPDSLHA